MFTKARWDSQSLFSLLEFEPRLPAINSNLKLSWSPQPVDHSDVTSLPEVPAKTTLEDLMSKIKHLSDPSTVKSVEMSWTEYSQSGDIVHRERYPVHLARYINEIISFRNMLEEVRDFKSWLVELLPWDHAILRFFDTHPYNECLVGFRLQEATVRTLCAFRRTTWLHNSAVDHGLDVIRHSHPHLSNRILLAGCDFWDDLLPHFLEHPHRPPVLAEIPRVVDEYITQRNTIELLCFPLLYKRHWFAVFVSFVDLRIRFAEGMGLDPHPDLVPAILFFLDQYLKLDTSMWPSPKSSPKRSPSPKQPDGHSCGILALTLLEQQYTGTSFDYPKWLNMLKISWITRCIDLHETCRDVAPFNLPDIPQNDAVGTGIADDDVASQNQPEAIPSTQIDSPGDSPCVPEVRVTPGDTHTKILNEIPYPLPDSDKPIMPDDGVEPDSLFLAKLNGELQDLHKASTELLPRISDPLERLKDLSFKKDPLPYTTEVMTDEQKLCEFCGPPFKVMTQEEMLASSACSFECAKRYVVEVLAKRRGFRIVHGKTVKRPDGSLITLQLNCEKARKPTVQKSQIAPSGQRVSRSKRTDCSFRINLNRPAKSQGAVRFSTVILKHTHTTVPVQDSGLSFLRPLTEEEKEQVAISTLVGDSRGKVLQRLALLNPDKTAHYSSASVSQAVSNTMHKTKTHAKMKTQCAGGQMAELHRRFAEKVRLDNWVMEIWLNSNGRVGRLFWMTPAMLAWVRLYGTQILVDGAEGRNSYRMALTTFCVINGNNQSRNVAHCLHETKDQGTYEWMLTILKRQIENSIASVIVKSIFSDRERAIAAALIVVWPEVFHGVCLWHLTENIKKNLRPVMGQDFHPFLNQFWETYSKGSPASFEIAWNRLLRQWPAASRYLTANIYPDREKWAWAWVGLRFSAGTRTTGRVEGEHSVYKLLDLGAASDLNEVMDKLCDRSTAQQEREQEMLYKTSLLRYEDDPQVDNYFGPIAKLCKKYLTWYAWTVLHKEMVEATKLGDISRVSIEESDEEPGGIPCYNPMHSDGSLGKPVPIRYEDLHLSLQSLIDCVPEGDRERMVIYRVKPRSHFDAQGGEIPVRKRYVAVQANGGFVCSCAQGIHQGIPCRHALAVLLSFPVHGFNIRQAVHPHWIIPTERVDYEGENNWIRLGSSIHLPSSAPPSQTLSQPPPSPQRSLDIVRPPPPSSAPPQFNPSQYFDAVSNTPMQMRSPRRSQSQHAARYNEMNKTWDDFMRAHEHDPMITVAHFKAMIEQQTQRTIEKEAAVSRQPLTPTIPRSFNLASATPADLLNSDPIAPVLNGRKREARFKSSNEIFAKKPKTKRKKKDKYI